ncbi:MAG: alpha/beta fold hydrolase, partial [Hyphomonas sp.]|nr:alpha/beta fold hydrolase [Hyphomonas sp.]
MTTEHFTSRCGRRLAHRRHAPTRSDLTYVWLCGFKSDITGTKVMRLETWTKEQGHGFLAFDYSGHGESSGAFEDGTISQWREDALDAIDALTDGPLILVGSSMGGWMALLAGLARRERLAGMVLVAPAPDFTQKLMWPEFTPRQQEEITITGQTLRPSEYGEPYIITRALIEDGRGWALLDGPIDLECPVRILQ